MNIKRSVRLTRRSYRRKLIMFGVSVFMSLALTATGFAAWVLSKDETKNAEGTVEIGAVTEASVEITDITFLKNSEEDLYDPAKFVFEPLATDTTGRVRYDGESQPENLDVRFSWKVSNFQIVGELYVDFEVPANVYKAIENQWLALPDSFELLDTVGKRPDANGVEKEYKILRYVIHDADTKLTVSPNWKETEDDILKYKTNAGEVINEVEFEMTIAFSWGAAFNGINPGLYYDTDTVGMEVEHDQIKETLNKFKTTVHGINYDKPLADDTKSFGELTEERQALLYEDNPIDKYFVTITANVA